MHMRVQKYMRVHTQVPMRVCTHVRILTCWPDARV